MNIGSKKFNIEPQLVDFQSNVKLSYLIDLILIASGYNADENQFGIRDLNKLGGTWVLSRLSIEMSNYPTEYDQITIETWISDVNTSNTIRNFYIKDKTGEILGKATSVWVMINLETRRPMEMRLLEGITNFIVDRGDEDFLRTRKLNSVVGEAVLDAYIKYTDIDINQHVNTVRYIDWMINTFDLDEHRENLIQRLDLNFMSEILFDENILLYKQEIENNRFGFELKANQRVACRGEIKLAKR